MEKDRRYQEEEPQESYNDGGTLGYAQSFDQQHLQITQPLHLPRSAREERLRFLRILGGERLQPIQWMLICLRLA